MQFSNCTPAKFQAAKLAQWDNGYVKLQHAVVLCLIFLSASCFAATRHYYIAAEEVNWDYAPSNHNLLTGEPLPPPWLQKHQWPKTRFIEYTDDTFTTPKPQPEWLGILGPVIRAEVGDEVLVEFFNRTQNFHNMHPHGLHYDKNSEGAFYLPFGKGAHVGPGIKYTYHWFATPASGPGPGQPSSIVWWYHAHEGREINAGLLGPIVVTAKGKANPDGSPKDVDREFIASFMIFDQLGIRPEGQFYAINGYIFGNLPGLTMKQGEKVRWHLLGMGNEIDLHSPHWHGETVTYEGRNTDVVELLPGSMKTVDMVADNPGTWMFHCHVLDHMEAGMMAVFTIAPTPTRSCPVAFTGGDFWKHPETFSLKVKNTSDKAISSLAITPEMLFSPQDLRRPYRGEWSASKQIQPGEEQTLEKPGVRADSAQTVMGWVLMPTLIKFSDGSAWRAEREGECFGVIWRDEKHPDMETLPPRQKEINPD
ncbi:MAG TPA: multicopper oxidase domain-containing protein [Candidatus Acidoferrum sp.]|nr:multicopper oxidase domain-containing protein [Candidatus Acidoferrum sp.]